MKDYSMTKEEKEMFILNYEINEGRIIVNFATGEKSVIPFTKKNIKKLQSKMKEQVRKSEDYKIKTKNEIKKFKIILFILVGAIYLNFNTFINGIFDDNLITFLGSNPLIWIGSIGVLCSISAAVFYACSLASYKKNINDIEKNELFLKNEKLLNKKVDSNEKSLLNSKINKENINSLEVPTININTIDKMKYETLKQILLDIKRDELLDFDYTTDPNKTQKIYIKK